MHRAGRADHAFSRGICNTLVPRDRYPKSEDDLKVRVQRRSIHRLPVEYSARGDDRCACLRLIRSNRVCPRSGTPRPRGTEGRHWNHRDPVPPRLVAETLDIRIEARARGATAEFFRSSRSGLGGGFSRGTRGRIQQRT